MNKTIITAVAAFIVMGTMVASVEEANAVVCARGVIIAPVALGGTAPSLPAALSSLRAGSSLLRAGSSCGAPFIETLLC
jgi:hypothetical protein